MRKASAVLRIHVPPKARHVRFRVAHGPHPHYISTATAAVTVTLAGPNGYVLNATASLQAGATGCTSTLAGVTCSLTVPDLTPCIGASNYCYTGSISTWDAVTGCPSACVASGNELSKNAQVAFTVTAGAANSIGVTLAGIPAQTIIVPVSPMVESYGDVYHLLGTGAHAFLAETLDADQQLIAGAGAPQFTITPSGSSPIQSSVTTTTATAPNSFSLTSLTTDGQGAFTVTPTFPAAPSGCSASCPSFVLSVDTQPAIFVADYNPLSPDVGSIEVLDENGYRVPVTGTFPNVNGPTGMAYDSINNELYVANTNGQAVTAYDANGDQQPLSGALAYQSFPSGIAFDPQNGLIYVAASQQLNGYTSNGALSVSAASPQNGPNGLLYNSTSNLLYVSTYSGISAYTPALATQTLSGSFSDLDQPIGMTSDSSLIYAVNFGNHTVTAYDTQGNESSSLSGGFPGAYAYGISYLPSTNGERILVGAQATQSINVYDAQGNKLSSGGFPAGPPFSSSISAYTFAIDP